MDITQTINAQKYSEKIGSETLTLLTLYLLRTP